MKKYDILMATTAVVALSVAFYSQSKAADIVAGGNDCGNGNSCSWSIDADGKLIISGSGTMKDSVPWGSYKSQIKSVDISYGITSVADSAFRGAKNLQNVTIPNSVTSIGANAFRDTILTSVDIPNSVTSIKDSAFRSSQLKSIVIPGSVTSIGDCAFEDNYQLTTATFGNLTASIGRWIFDDNTKLSEVFFEGDLSGITFNIGTFTGTTDNLIIKFPENDANRAILEKMLKNAEYSASDGYHFEQATLMSYTTDDEGNKIIARKYEYDTTGNLLKITDTEGNIYDEDGNKFSYHTDGSYTKTDLEDNVYWYDSDGQLLRTTDILGNIYDKNGEIIEHYDNSGIMRYAKGIDGSDYYFDKNGNLKGMTKRGPFTIPEANALTKDGPVNTVTITW